MLLFTLLSLVGLVGWLNKPRRIGSLGDATDGAGISDGD
jgi:hypothetical protein